MTEGYPALTMGQSKANADRYVAVVNAESPRGRVLVHCGYQEELLRKLILLTLPQNSSSRSMFGDDTRKQLGELASLCHAMGLISDEEKIIISGLQKVRNHFAHQLRASYGDEKVRKALKSIGPLSIEDDWEVDGAQLTLNLFEFCAMEISFALMNRIAQLETVGRLTTPMITKLVFRATQQQR